LSNRTVGISERLPLLQALPLSLQHLFAMFGATVLVPFLVGLDTSVTLFTSGLGTLLYIVITKGRIPAYLGSSFAFIAALSGILAVKPGQIAPDERVAIAMGGCVTVGLIYIVVAAAIGKFGTGWVDKLLPPIVIGPVVMVIGLGLAGVAVNVMAMQGGTGTYHPEYFRVALVALAIAILAAVFLKGFLGVIPILIGIVGGYVVAYAFGQVNLSGVAAAKAMAVPHFTFPKFQWGAILTLAPISLVVITEHIGHLIVTEVSGLLGGPPNTTYGENIGVMAITRVYSVWVIGGAAVIAIAMSFFPPIGAIIRSIPTQVMGGICILLFGIIASAGVRMLVDAKVDFSDTRNLIIASVILVIGIGGAKIHLGPVEIGEMSLATYVGVILNLVLPSRRAGAPGEVGEMAAAPDV
jgi:uracil permease